MKKVRIISASFRPDSNSHALCEEAAIKGFVECFEGATLAGSVLADGVYEQGAVKTTKFMQEAYELGKRI
jgi:hypothetical protein